jgi:tetratricopeptide (TPR) repeat protein
MRLAAVGLLPPSATFDDHATLMDSVTLVFWAIGAYARYALVPYPLVAYHVVPFHFADRTFSTGIYFGALIAVSIALFLYRRRVPALIFWWGIFCVSLIPVLYFKAISNGVLFSERYLYIPTMPIVILVTLLAARLNTTHAILLMSIGIITFSILTLRRNPDWHDDETLFARTLSVQPEAAGFWSSLGEVYLQHNEIEQARICFENALRQIGDRRFSHLPYEDYRIQLGLGNVAARMHNPAEAKLHLRRALEVFPNGDGAYTILAAVLLNEDHDYDGAITLLQKAVNLNPASELSRDYMGVAFYNKQEYDKAVTSFRKALDINPSFEDSRSHLTMAMKAIEQAR